MRGVVPEQLERHPVYIKQIKDGMISGKTKLIGLLGQPVTHSLSPVIHNAALKAMGLDWCYIALPCETKNFEIVTKALREINCQGLNITIPHKQIALNVCNQIKPLAKKLGAINTLIPNKEGGWTGTNTDVEGFIAPLKEKKLFNKKAIVIGNGGSARAVIAGLNKLGFAEITVIGRNNESLTNFIKDLNSKFFNIDNSKKSLKGLLQDDQAIIKKIANANLIINTTPVGMSTSSKNNSHAKGIPLCKEFWEYLNPQTILYDLIYTPRPTSWLTLGASKGCEIIDGLEMLIQQGAESLKLWSRSNEVPIDVMREAAKQQLGH